MNLNIRIVNSEPRISHKVIAEHTGFSEYKILTTLIGFKNEDGQRDTVYITECCDTAYSDRTAFFELASVLNFDETFTETVREALGEFTLPKAEAQ
ncbi:hypothetical protein EOL70_13565 [Leucothrix sargassi]|nr:hypothetical protein EOL70_13565 [Leucothrix sargassi]